MDEQELRRILQSEKNLPGRGGRRCPDENQLIEYITGRLVGERRDALESHLADCDSCPDALAFMSRSSTWSTSVAPPAVVARARTLVKPRRANWRWSWAMTTVGVACVLLVVAMVAWRLRHQQANNPEPGPFVAQHREPERYTVPTLVGTSPSPVVPPSLHKPRPVEAAPPIIRGKTDELMPTLLSPREGEIVESDKLQFSWTAIQEAISYDLRVADLQGGLIFTESTTAPNFHPDTTRLQSGKYFVSVVAHLRDGRTAKSKLLSFRVAL